MCEKNHNICYFLFCEGFQSYVGEVIRVLKKEGLVDMHYGLCGAGGNQDYLRCTFTPWMFHNLSRINPSQKDKLLEPDVHESFDPWEYHRVI